MRNVSEYNQIELSAVKMAVNEWTFHLVSRRLQYLLILMDPLCATWMPLKPFTPPPTNIYTHFITTRASFNCVLITVTLCGLVITCYGLNHQISVIHWRLTSHTSRHADDKSGVGGVIGRWTVFYKPQFVNQINWFW